jgi:hypothetical protein
VSLLAATAVRTRVTISRFTAAMLLLLLVLPLLLLLPDPVQQHSLRVNQINMRLDFLSSSSTRPTPSLQLTGENKI